MCNFNLDLARFVWKCINLSIMLLNSHVRLIFIMIHAYMNGYKQVIHALYVNTI